MGAKHDYIRGQITDVRAQLQARQVKIGRALTALQRADERNNFRSDGGEDPVRGKTAAQFDGLKNLVDAVNANAVSLPSKVDFMNGFDAAIDE